jgi:hypothetical protein
MQKDWREKNGTHVVTALPNALRKAFNTYAADDPDTLENPWLSLPLLHLSTICGQPLSNEAD